MGRTPRPPVERNLDALGDTSHPNRGRAALKGRVKIPLKGRALAPADARNGIAFRPEKRSFSAHAEAEDRKLRKELNFGGPCFEGTLRKPTRCFRIKPRGRGDSGTQSLQYFEMPDAHESCRNAPSQPHKCSRFIVYTNPRKKVQALIDFSEGLFTGKAPASVFTFFFRAQNDRGAC